MWDLLGPGPAGHDFCFAQNVTYDHRVFDKDAHNWCPVPGGGADVLLFAALAVFASAALYSRLSAVWVLLAGSAFQLLSAAVNLNHFSNALTLMLGMAPPQLFFQIFLPPLLLDSALRLDFFLFKKLAPHVLIFAVVNVVLSTVAFIPVMLYGLRLAGHGWTVIDAALFGAMLGSTDAVAVSAILKAGGAPEMLSVLLEGESLFNDASSIVLFEVFLARGMAAAAGAGTDISIGEFVREMAAHIGYLSLSGAALGVLAGWLTRLIFKLVHKRHLPPHVEVAVPLAGAYMVYACTEYYIHGSGVIAVVVYGLYGASSFLYGFSSKGMRTGAFFKFYDVLSFIANGMVFFYVGSTITNYFVSLSEELFAGGSAGALLATLRGLPFILVAMFGLRCALMWLEAPILSLVGHSMTWQEVLFSTVGGLRGGLALILVNTVLAAHASTHDPRIKVVHAQMALWVSGVVLFTLTVNAAALDPLMRLLGLNKTTPLQRLMHKHAYDVLAQHTREAIASLQEDDDEMLKGVDWRSVAAASDVALDAKQKLKPNDPMNPKNAKKGDPGAGGGSKAPRRGDAPKPGSTPRGSIDYAGGGSNGTAAVGASSAAIATSLLNPLRRVALPGASPSSPSAAAGAAAATAAAATLRRSGSSSSGRAVKKSLSMFERAASSGSTGVGGGGGLTVPLLNRQYSARAGRGRYDSVTEDGSDEEGGGGDAQDVEAGCQRDVQAAARNTSEAVFIASRLDQQDAELAAHIQDAEHCPFLNINRSDAAAADDVDAAAEPSAADAAGTGDDDASVSVLSVGASTAAGGGSEAGDGASVADDGGDEDGGGEDGEDEDGVAAAHRAPAAEAAPFLEFLKPLVAVSSKDLAKAQATQPYILVDEARTRLQAHSAANQVPMGAAPPAPAPSAAAAAALPPAAAIAIAGGGRHGSIIAATNAAGGLAGALGIQHHGMARGGAVAGGGGGPPPQHQGGVSAPSDPEVFGRGGVRLLTNVWQQKQLQQQEQKSAATGSAAAASAAAASYMQPHPRDLCSSTSHDLHALPEWRLLEMDEMSDVCDMEAEQEYLEECRMSLLAGLKRHFRHKAAEGLLSQESLRLLEYTCDTALSRPDRPLNLWKECGRDISNYGLTAYVAAIHLQLRHYMAVLLRRRGCCGFWTAMMVRLLSRISLFLRLWLGRVAVTALEVALELWLALTVSPLAKMMRHSKAPATALLQEELQAQAATVWRFIMDRQLEAPDEFAALQTHRVKMAVARRQLAFVERLEENGAVEEATAEVLQELVERRLHRLESQGPVWQAPGIMQVLRRLPFLAEAPEGLLLWLRAYGELRSYKPGQCIIARKRVTPPGVYVVLSGLVRVEVERGPGRQESRFVGVGGSVGLVPSIIGRDTPNAGLVAAYGQGNAMGKGPMVLHLPMRLLAALRERAAVAVEAAVTNDVPISSLLPGASADGAAAPSTANLGAALATGMELVAAADAGQLGGSGDEAGAVNAATFAQLLLDMHRYAGIMILDRMAPAMVVRLTKHLEAAAQGIFAYVSQLPPKKALPTLQRLLHALLGSSGGLDLALSADAGPRASIEVSRLSAGGAGTAPPPADGVGGSAASTEQGGAAGGGPAAAAAKAGGAAGLGGVPDSDAAIELLRQRAAAAVVRLRDLMCGADLVNVGPGEHVSQASTIMVLSGSLRLHGSGSGPSPSPKLTKRRSFLGRRQQQGLGAVAEGVSTQAFKQFGAPAVLVWGPELFGSMEDRYDSGVRQYSAGPAGALLLVTSHGDTAGARTSIHPSTAPGATAGTPTKGAAAAAAAAASGGSASRPGSQPRMFLRSVSKLQRSVAANVDEDEEDV